MASSCHLNWTELYKNAQTAEKGSTDFAWISKRCTYMIGLSIWSANAHTHTVYQYFVLVCSAHLSFINAQVFRQDSSSVSASHRSCVFSKDCRKTHKPNRAKDKFNCFSKCHPKNLQDLQVHMSCKWLQNFKFPRFLSFLIEKEWF